MSGPLRRCASMAWVPFGLTDEPLVPPPPPRRLWTPEDSLLLVTVPLRRSEPVTAPFLICAELVMRTFAATAVPPRATTSATIEMTSAGLGLDFTSYPLP